MVTPAGRKSSANDIYMLNSSRSQTTWRDEAEKKNIGRQRSPIAESWRFAYVHAHTVLPCSITGTINLGDEIHLAQCSTTPCASS